MLTLPTSLTLVRVAAVPVLIAGKHMVHDPMHCSVAAAPNTLTTLCPAVWFSGWLYAAPACATLFVCAALTDFLDGYLARTMVRLLAPRRLHVPTHLGGAQSRKMPLPVDAPSLVVLTDEWIFSADDFGALSLTQDTASAFGAFLDPVADKLMVAAVLILISTHPIASGSLAGNMWLLPTLSAGAP